MIDNMIAYSVDTLVMFADWVFNTPTVLLFGVFGIVVYLFAVVLSLTKWGS